MPDAKMPFEVFPSEYSKWEADKTPENLNEILKVYSPLLSSEARRLEGAISPGTLKSQAKKFAIQAIQKYDPLKNIKLSTWITNYLKQLNRTIYSAQQAARMPENLQMMVGQYKTAIDELKQDLGREPSNVEISEKIGRPISFVEKLNKQVYNELQEGLMDYDPSVIESSDPRIDYVYHDLGPQEKVIFEHLTGYGGKPIKSKKEVSKLMGISQPMVSIKSKKIANLLEAVLGEGKYG